MQNLFMQFLSVPVVDYSYIYFVINCISLSHVAGYNSFEAANFCTGVKIEKMILPLNHLF